VRLSGSASRPETILVSSIRIALGGSVANTGRSCSIVRSRPSGVESSPLASARSTRKRTNGTDAATAARIASGPSLWISSAGSAPDGIGTTRSSSLRLAARLDARNIASWPAVSASSASSTV
jgi:hypothetical protein